MFGIGKCAMAAAALAWFGAVSIACAAEQGEAPSAQPEVPVIQGKGKCDPGRKAYSYTNASVSTSSTTEAVLPVSKIRFKQGGNKPDCVIVEFTGYAFAGGANNGIFIVARRGSQNCAPAPVMLVAESDTLGSSNAFTWICPDVPPGKRNIKIMWRSFSGSTVSIHNRTVVVHYQ